MSHTPLPWKAREDFGRRWISAGKGKKSVQIADVSDIETGVGSGEVETDAETTDSNADLIVLAVNCHAELLAALEDMLAGYEDTLRRFGHGGGDAEKARAVIAKAKGAP